MNRFPDHARVLFIGDSITCGGLWIAHIYDHYLRHFPDAGIRMYNAGISGGSCASALLYYDAGNGENYRPTHAVVMLGINDVGRHLYEIAPGEADVADKRLIDREEHLRAYEKGLRELTALLTERGVRITFVAPTGYDETQLPRELDKIGCDAAMERIAEVNRRLAAETGSDFVNMHAAMRWLNSARVMTRPDRVHPDDQGHVCMAHVFLAAQGLTDEPTPLSLDSLPAPDALLDANAARFSAEKDVRNYWNVQWLLLRNQTGTHEEKLAYLRDFRTHAPSPFWAGLIDRYFELGEDIEGLQKRESELVEALCR